METFDLKHLLEEFGLTKTEAKVFSEINLTGSSRIGKLIKNTQLHRGTVYNTLQRLKNKGLVYTSKKDKVNYHYINPTAFHCLFNEEQESLERKRELVKKIRDCVKSARILNKDEKPEVYSLEGKQSFKGFFLDLLKRNKDKEENYLFLGNGGEMQDVMGATYYKNSQIMKVLIGTKCKVVLNIDKKDHTFSTVVRGNIKWLPKENDFLTVNHWIYGSKVVIVDWKSRPLTTIVIDNKNIAESYKTIWKTFWAKEAVKQEELYDMLGD